MERNNDDGLCPVCGNVVEDGYCDQCGYSADGNGWMDWYPGRDD